MLENEFPITDPALAFEQTGRPEESSEVSLSSFLQGIYQEYRQLEGFLQRKNLTPEEREETQKRMARLISTLKSLFLRFHEQENSSTTALQKNLASEEKEKIMQQIENLRNVFQFELIRIVYEEFGGRERNSRLAQLKSEFKQLETSLSERRKLSPEEREAKEQRKQEIIAILGNEFPIYAAVRGELAQVYQGFIRADVEKRSKGAFVEDLIQEESIGFLEAIDRCDPFQSRLSTYATSWLKKYFYGARNSSNNLKYSQSFKRKWLKIKNAEKRLRIILKKEPTDAEIAVYLQDMEQVKETEKKSNEKKMGQKDDVDSQKATPFQPTQQSPSQKLEDLEAKHLEKFSKKAFGRGCFFRDPQELWKEDIQSRALQDKSKDEMSFFDWTEINKKAMNAAEVHYTKYVMGLNGVGSLDEEVKTNEGQTQVKIDYVAYHTDSQVCGSSLHAIDPQTALEMKQAREFLQRAFEEAKLTVQEIDVLRGFYGLLEGDQYDEEQTLEHIGTKYGVRKQRMGVVKDQALEKLKSYARRVKKDF